MNSEGDTSMLRQYIERVAIPPNRKCAGCTGGLTARHALEVLGSNTVALGVASCGGGWSGRMLVCSPLGYCCFPSGGGAASGVARGFSALGKKVNVVLFAGDGGTYDIGLQALSAAAERDENIIWICTNNEAYMNTGVQRSGATPIWAETTTTPVGKMVRGKQTEKKEILSTIEGSGAAYLATASMAYIADFKKKVGKSKKISTDERKGLSFLDVLNTCPTGWRYPTDRMIEVSRLAVLTRWWPLYEIEEGEFRISLKPKKYMPIDDFIKIQGRFRHISDEQLKFLQEKVDKRWVKILKRAEEQ